MPRIRTLTLAGVLAGATVVGGAGLAGATDPETTGPDAATARQDQTVEVDAVELTTGEPDHVDDGAEAGPVAPVLPAEASDQARDALAAASAFSQSSEASDDGAHDQQAEDATAPEAPATQSDHGQDVSETAHATEPGPDHGPTVAETAQQNGQRPDDAGGPAEHPDDDTPEPAARG